MPDLYVSTSTKTEKSRPAPGVHQAPGHTHNPLAAYSYCPDHTHFETQEAGEKIILLLRKHPITNVSWILLVLGLIATPTALGFVPIAALFPAKFAAGALALWYLLALAIALEGALGWFFNVYIVTDERIIDVDFHNLIYREISDAKIDKIQDVTYKVGGVVRTLFDYGDVVIQTAGTVPNFDFAAVPNPAQVAKILQQLRTQEEQEAAEGRIR